MRNVVFDARLAGVEHAGIGRYAEELLRAMVQKKTCRFTVIVRSTFQLPWLIAEAKNNDLVSVRVINVPHYSILEQLVMPVVYASISAEVLHAPHFNLPVLSALFSRKRKIVTIHDLLWHKKKERDATTLSPHLHAIKHAGYRLSSEMAIRKADCVIVPSSVVSKEVVSVVQPRKLQIIPIGIHERFYKKPGKQSTLSTSLPNQYLLYVGSAYPHKNLEYLLQIMQLLPKISLVISSARTVFIEKLLRTIATMGLSSRVHVVENATDEELCELYHRASMFISTSTSEGFGLPALEAMAAGTPVAVSDLPVFRELYKDAPLYLSLKSAKSDARLIDTYLSRGKNEQDQSVRITIAKQYRWSDIAGKTIQVYESNT